MLLGIDVGGTHTDVVVVDARGVRAAAKVVTNHENLFESVNGGIAAMLREVDAAGIERINLSTTLSTNAIVENTIEKVGMLVSAGPGIEPASFTIGDQYHRIEGALDHRGAEILPLDEKRLEKAIAACRKAGIKAYAAVSKFSTRNPAHENSMREALAGSADFITQGHAISGNLNFPRRIATAYYNSSVWRIYNRFADAVEKALGEYGVRASVNVLKADGGTMPLAVSRLLPVETILSGPSASVMGILALCDIGVDSVVLDIGGTTTDIAVFASGGPLIEPDGIALNGRNTLVRALRTRSIGIGGDSLLRVEGGEARVGPERLGPAVADGGVLATLVDAFNRLGADAHGNTEASARAMEDLAKKNGMNGEELARRAVERATAFIKSSVDEMIAEINERPVYTIHEMLEGRRIAPERIYVVGGPAEAFRKELARAFSLEVTVPRDYAVANAIGAALARTTMSIELLADTEMGMLMIPELGVSREVPASYTLEEAGEDARRYLIGHLGKTAPGERVQAEVVHAASFNMVRGYHTAGRNIRVRCQVKPGILEKYEKGVRGTC
ncbi:MAG TPA: hydantoinase/oxoprolinase family protein [Spirochaetota bacterium]|nr:hydantoinase/oxoprolinase family protein [Spirochaetota bacterium]HNU92687.1 hydantoinase/oxoprolinase family protein [Spirochaetota bacterium]HPI14566.1 hydantoinase/oxoprolinase family protein [Spirochaetota bacterium]HPO46300.1 hydantoinase/oxoprolinase family protein [Spirochaetota bacterium]HPV98734.1 hydantoinase/oxoprolinase family protein [Spirochaetota bacterium]